jgi:plastocyanin
VRSLVLVASMVALSSVACSGGGGDGGTKDCTDLSKSGPTFTIHIQGFEFRPSCFTASASQAISIANGDDAVHSFTIQGTSVDVDVPANQTFNGESVSGVVEPGTYDFVCRYHPEMKGTVTVVA